MFNGTPPIPIGEGIKEWFFRNLNNVKRELTTLRYDPKRGNVWVFYPSSNSDAMDSCLVYNVRRKRWGVADMSVEAVVYMTTPSVSWETIDDVGASWDALPDIPWDSAYWSAGVEKLAVFNTSHELKALSGTSTGGQLTIWDSGDDTRVSMLRSSRLRFTRAPTSAQAQGMVKMESGVSGMPGNISTYSGGKFDHRQSGRWHSVAYTMTGPFDVAAGSVELIPQGQR